MRINGSTIYGAALAGAALLIAAGPAAADVMVLETKATSLSRGAVLKDGEVLELPAGGRVTVVLPNGNTRSLKGPARTPVKDLSKGEAIDREAWSSIESLIRATEPRAATRGITAAPGAARSILSRFSWRDVPIDAEGDYCVEKGARLSLVRPLGTRVDTVSVVDVQGGTRAEARFAAGRDTADWPTEVAIKVGSYALVAAGGPKRQFTLRLISPLPDADSTLRVLASQKCKLQAEAWLRALAVS